MDPEFKPKLPKSVDPDPEDVMFERLVMEDQEFKELDFIRRHMKLILTQEQEGKFHALHDWTDYIVPKTQNGKLNDD